MVLDLLSFYQTRDERTAQRLVAEPRELSAYLFEVAQAEWRLFSCAANSQIFVGFSPIP